MDLIIRAGYGAQRFYPVPAGHLQFTLQQHTAAPETGVDDLSDRIDLYLRGPFDVIYFENLPSTMLTIAFDVRHLMRPGGRVFYVGAFTVAHIATVRDAYRRIGARVARARKVVHERVMQRLMTRLLLEDAGAEWDVLEVSVPPVPWQYVHSAMTCAA